MMGSYRLLLAGMACVGASTYSCHDGRCGWTLGFCKSEDKSNQIKCSGKSADGLRSLLYAPLDNSIDQLHLQPTAGSAVNERVRNRLLTFEPGQAKCFDNYMIWLLGLPGRNLTRSIKRGNPFRKLFVDYPILLRI